jgi:hypothetical protein
MHATLGCSQLAPAPPPRSVIRPTHRLPTTTVGELNARHVRSTIPSHEQNPPAAVTLSGFQNTDGWGLVPNHAEGAPTPRGARRMLRAVAPRSPPLGQPPSGIRLPENSPSWGCSTPPHARTLARHPNTRLAARHTLRATPEHHPFPLERHSSPGGHHTSDPPPPRR